MIEEDCERTHQNAKYSKSQGKDISDLLDELRSCRSSVERSVSFIINDIKSRSGLSDAWEEIDDSTKEEIINNWHLIVFFNLLGDKVLLSQEKPQTFSQDRPQVRSEIPRDRFTEGASKPVIERNKRAIIYQALGLARSMILSGEDMTPEAEKIFNDAFSALDP